MSHPVLRNVLLNVHSESCWIYQKSYFATGSSRIVSRVQFLPILFQQARQADVFSRNFEFWTWSRSTINTL